MGEMLKHKGLAQQQKWMGNGELIRKCYLGGLMPMPKDRCSGKTETPKDQSEMNEPNSNNRQRWHNIRILGGNNSLDY